MKPIDVLVEIIGEELSMSKSVLGNRVQALCYMRGMSAHPLDPLIKELENQGFIKVSRGGVLITISKP